MNNMLISTTEVFVIIAVVLFLAFVVYLQVRRKKTGKSNCSFNASCSSSGSSCKNCNIKEYMKNIKKDEQP